MVKVIFPDDASTKFEIQKWMKQYKLAYTPFQSKDELLYIISENKKIIFDLEKDKKKAEKLAKQQQATVHQQHQSDNTTTSTSYQSSSSSSSSSSSQSSTTTRLYTSPFKKIIIKDGKVFHPNDLNTTSTSANIKPLDATVLRHVKPRQKLNLATKVDNNIVHVFVSSTFKDMIGERDHLIKVVFPALNMKAKAKNLTIVPVDLRWGLTKEDTTVKGQIELCLKQIEKCHITLGMVGSRAGWVPSEYKLVNSGVSDGADTDQTARWLSELPLGHSITAIEMLYALHGASQGNKHCVALVRDNESLKSVPPVVAESFTVESEEAKQRLDKFKQTLVDHPNCTVLEGYPATYGGVDRSGNPFVRDLHHFGEFVIEQLWDIIELEFPTPVGAPDSIEREFTAHKSVLDNKSAHYYGREAFQQKLMKHVSEKTSIDSIGVVYGETGAGKTSSLAYFTKTMESDPSWVVLYHFVGCSGNSTEVANILARFSSKLIKTFKLKIEVSESFEKLRIDFPVILSQCKNKKILIVIEDLDLLNPSNQAHQLEWLPESSDLPSNVVVLLSCDQGKTCWDYLHLRPQIPQTFYLTPLEMNERQLIFTKTLERFGKRLDSKQLDRLISKTHSKLPLFITLVCEELRVFGSFDKLSSFINKMPETIGQVINQMVSRLEEDFGKDLIKRTLCFIALSRFGLTETELLDLLARSSSSSTLSRYASAANKQEQHQQLPFVVWAPLLINLAPLLREANRHVLTFFHGEIANVIVHRYLSNEKTEIAVHQLMSDYYLTVADPESDRFWSGVISKPFLELPYHLSKAKRWDLLAALYQDLKFIESNFRISLGREMIERLLCLINEVRGPALSGERWTGYNFSSANIVEEFFAFIQYQAHHLMRFPFASAQLALNLPDDSTCHAAATKMLINKALHFRWVNKSQISDFVISTLAGHEDFVRAALYKHDGSLLASCSDDKTIRIWSGETGAMVRVFPKLHTDKITSLSWRSNTLVTVSRDKRIILWDEYGRVISEFKDGHTNAVWGVSVSGDGNRLVTASWDGTAIVWDVATKKPVHKLTAHSPQKLSACAYSHNNKWVATGCWGGILIIWDAATGNELQRFKISDFSVLCLQFSKDDSMLALSSVDSSTYVFNTRSWQKVKLDGHTEAVISSRFSSDGKYLVSCSDDKTVRLFETNEWTQVSVMTGHSGRIISCAFHPTSARIQVVTGATDKFIKIWDPKLGYATTQMHQGHKKSVTALQYDHNTDCLYSCSDDKTIKVWDQFTRKDLLSYKESINALSLKTFRLDRNTSRIVGLTAGEGTGSILVADLNGKIISKVDKGAHAFALSDDGKHVAMALKEGVVVVYDLESKTDIYSARHGFVVNEVSFSPNNEFLAASDGKGTFTVLKRNGNQYSFVIHQELNPMSAITSMAWSSTVLALGTQDGPIHLFDIKRTFYPLRILKNHLFAVRTMSFTPNGKYLMSASFDKQAILWDVQQGTIATIFPLASISTSNILIFRDETQGVLTAVTSDYTGKIHHLKIVNCDQDA
ncbi:hypothetical protein SAMD00019534_118590 [Acytostelium subglobosum LB1]|uniref:hypothetical protein n=1 Tax=Acytostelium subglobosum LB1 TaxID=1410327 RepID=UPI000644D785|nr:hypothetical protein SAMD00019534_118590 [Acytostelium subglobosum LB1]GAM28683.1 hypothetical protein SAMD00019534_118590 [Acytostelium subglobosum LB1]|eukprot:XP_012748461.1 hypothetical protein SAMD00019534_118590 [Acytostelium subglobosum LB1]